MTMFPEGAVDNVSRRASKLADRGMHPDDALAEAALEVARDLFPRAPDQDVHDAAKELERRARRPKTHDDLDFSGVGR